MTLFLEIDSSRIVPSLSLSGMDPTKVFEFARIARNSFAETYGPLDSYDATSSVHIV